MTLSPLLPHPQLTKPEGPVVILVADGVGIADNNHGNAVAQATTPILDGLMKSKLYTTLKAHGVAVGLPSDDDMGNSEVGHNAIGAGRIFAQGAKLVNGALSTGSIFQSEVWKTAIKKSKKNTLHFLGLHSDGNIHAHTNHLYQMMQHAAEQGVRDVCLHIILDGRDVDVRSALTYITQTEQKIQSINQKYNSHFRIASGGGRMNITMDRYDADWDMVQRGYECHTHGIGHYYTSASEAVEDLYQKTGKDDQYLPAFAITKDNTPIGLMKDNDAVILFNFRGDRAIEISKVYEQKECAYFDRNAKRAHPSVYFAGMLQYDGDENIPQNYLVDPPKIDNTMGEYFCATGLRSFAISETQKYGHVTFFWNGNRSGYIDESLEEYINIPSHNQEFNEVPHMRAREITQKTITLIESGSFDFGRLNLANGDMVGHTGDMNAAIKAMEVIDECIGRLIDAIKQANGILIVTADHGNADIMFEEKNGQRIVKTSHTLNPVPFAIIDANKNMNYALNPPQNAGLSHIAATVINLLGYQTPKEYQPSLLTVK